MGLDFNIRELASGHKQLVTCLLMLGVVETVIFAVSVLVVTGTMHDVKSNDLEGSMVSLCSPLRLYLQHTNQATACGTLYYHRFVILGYPHWSVWKSCGLISRLTLLCPVQLFFGYL